MRTASKERLMRIGIIISAVLLCTFIVIPTFAILFGQGMRLITSNWRSYSAILLFKHMAMMAALGISGFVMGLYVSYYCKSKEMIITLLSAMITAVSFFILNTIFNLIINLITNYVYSVDWVLEIIFGSIYLIAFALMGAMLVVKKGPSKTWKTEEQEKGDILI